jgi:hypothetical protein
MRGIGMDSLMTALARMLAAGDHHTWSRVQP